MNDSSMNLATKMEALKQKYLVQLETKIESLRIFVRTCEVAKPGDDQVKKLCDLAHKLSGSGATYGFTTISESAQVLEDLLLVKPPVDESVMATKAKLLLEACENAHGSLPLSSPHDSAFSLDEPENVDDLPTILLVDDDETIRQIVPQIFHGTARIVIANNGREAIEHLKHIVPIVILLDDHMPELGGFDFLEELKKKNESISFGIIMLTASRKNTDVLMAYRLGVVDYISKPFDPEELRVRVLDYIVKHRKKIVVADDDPTISNLLSIKFRALGYQVFLSGDCETTYDIVIKEQPNLLVLDRLLPGGDGMAVFLKVKKQLGNIPKTVFLTTKRQEADILEAIKLGASDYIIKPFKVDDIVARCSRLLTRQEPT